MARHRGAGAAGRTDRNDLFPHGAFRRKTLAGGIVARMQKPRRKLAVVMQRRETHNRWQSVLWEPWSVLESDEPAGAPRLLVERPGHAQWLHAGFELVLHRDEAEGYYLNLTSGKPSVFVLWREDEGVGVPLQVTA
ncbi:MAG: DUF3305 domain-containing protein, partial [Betaproteobacteria bacterium]|nr:DUF3305 domain-containing protein [Betaproteobacteria bacterium]